MNITEVRISLRLTKEEKLKAFASITIDNAFVVRGLKIIRRGTGELFIAMPSRQTKSGDSQDICHPINQQTRDQIERLVLQKFAEAVGSESSTEGDPDAAGPEAGDTPEQSFCDIRSP